MPRCLYKRTGTFTLAYEGESTDSIAYNADNAELAAALGNLSTLAGSNVTAQTSNCSTPEVTCAWRIAFVDVYGDAELLTADVGELGGNAAAVTVIEEVKGQDTLDVDGSPVLVRVTNVCHMLEAPFSREKRPVGFELVIFWKQRILGNSDRSAAMYTVQLPAVNVHNYVKCEW